jgi:hypothetical protein
MTEHKVIHHSYPFEGDSRDLGTYFTFEEAQKKAMEFLHLMKSKDAIFCFVYIYKSKLSWKKSKLVFDMSINDL